VTRERIRQIEKAAHGHLQWLVEMADESPLEKWMHQEPIFEESIREVL
jgi:hypothetical protein